MYLLCKCDPQLVVHRLLGRLALDLSHRSDAEIRHPAKTGEERLCAR